MPVVQHPVLASTVCRRWLWMLGLCGSTSPEINFQQSLGTSTFFLSKVPQTQSRKWNLFLTQTGSSSQVSYFGEPHCHSSRSWAFSLWYHLWLSLLQSSSSGPIYCWANLCLSLPLPCPTFRSCFSKQIPRILQGLHADILRDLSVLHPKFYIFFSCSW